jgi:hypothetical protein
VLGKTLTGLFVVTLTFLVFAYNTKADNNIKQTQTKIEKLNKTFSNNTNNVKKRTDLLQTNSTISLPYSAKTDTTELSFDGQNDTANNSIQDENYYFTNTTTVNPLELPTLTNNINLLYKMGYLPFYAKSIDDNTGIVTWQWNSESVPNELASLTPKSLQSILYKSAIKHFLSDMGLKKDSNISSLLQDAYQNHWQSPKPFVWVLVDKKQPERLKVWQNGSWIIESNCNTGVKHLTPNGSFIVYARYKKFTMSGRFPIDDKPYYDPDVPYVNFFHGGIAIHGFKRYAYGYPQSAGCVELPVKTAEEIFPYLYIGTLVTIVN